MELVLPQLWNHLEPLEPRSPFGKRFDTYALIRIMLLTNQRSLFRKMSDPVGDTIATFAAAASEDPVWMAAAVGKDTYDAATAAKSYAEGVVNDVIAAWRDEDRAVSGFWGTVLKPYGYK